MPCPTYSAYSRPVTPQNPPEDNAFRKAPAGSSKLRIGAPEWTPKENYSNPPSPGLPAAPRPSSDGSFNEAPSQLPEGAPSDPPSCGSSDEPDFSQIKVRFYVSSCMPALIMPSSHSPRTHRRTKPPRKRQPSPRPCLRRRTVPSHASVTLGQPLPRFPTPPLLLHLPPPLSFRLAAPMRLTAVRRLSRRA